MSSVVVKGTFHFVRCRTWSMKRRIDFSRGYAYIAPARWLVMHHEGKVGDEHEPDSHGGPEYNVAFSPDRR